jgi:hypothetical protein
VFGQEAPEVNRAISALIKRFSEVGFSKSRVIPWSCPVPSFGDLFRAKVATLGLNPSNREFVDGLGCELVDGARRFHTLGSLGLSCWSDATPRHAELIWESCIMYFSRNPYDAWFRQLDHLITETTSSYYGMSEVACHLDLIPYATACKWTGLSNRQRDFLFSVAGDTLGLLLRDSSIRLLVLNGRSVVVNFERLAGLELDRQLMRAWDLRRSSRPNVAGVAYTGTMTNFSGLPLRRKVLVIGFNHNIQSSFGVSREVRGSIRSWIGRTAGRVL